MDQHDTAPDGQPDPGWWRIKPGYLPRRGQRTIEHLKARPPGHRRAEPDATEPSRPELEVLERIAAMQSAVERSRRDPDEPARVFWSPDYVAPAHAFDTTRKSRTISELVAARGHANVAPPGRRSLDDAERLIVGLHDPAYVDALRTGDPRELAESQGFEWDEGIWTMAVASTAGVIDALRLVLDDGGAAGSLSSGLHHARADRGHGFCTVNGLAVAAAWARDRAAKIAILDVDAHCGGGTHSFIGAWGLDNMVHLDASTNDFDHYDPGAGPHELVVARRSEEYVAAVDRMVEQIVDAAPDAVLYNAGMDAIELVPVDVLRGRELFVAGRLREAGVPCVFVLAGGYETPLFSHEQLANLHTATVEAFVDH